MSERDQVIVDVLAAILIGSAACALFYVTGLRDDGLPGLFVAVVAATLAALLVATVFGAIWYAVRATTLIFASTRLFEMWRRRRWRRQVWHAWRHAERLAREREVLGTLSGAPDNVPRARIIKKGASRWAP